MAAANIPTTFFDTNHYMKECVRIAFEKGKGNTRISSALDK